MTPLERCPRCEGYEMTYHTFKDECSIGGAMEDQAFTTTIRLGNDAMQTPEDVARALRRIADKLDSEGSNGYYQTILDENGNDVGRWKMGYTDRPGIAELCKCGEELDENGEHVGGYGASCG